MDGPADLAEDLPTTETVVLDAVADLVAEVQAVAAPVHPTLDSRFERDLGLDSLAIAELESRLEQLLAVRLPESVLATVDTPRELVRALRAGGARRIGGTRAVSPPAVPAPVSAPEQAGTLLEVLDAHARSHPERVHLTVLHEDRAERVDYASLRREAAATARGLVARGIEPGETVALMLPTSREYFTTFFGVLLAGAVPVPIYPPARRSQIEDHLRRHARILENARAAALVTTSEARRLARLVRARVPALRDVVDAAELPAGGRDEHAARVGSHDLALLQYTSGSTGAPKGVMLTHANLLANIRAMGRASGVTSDDVFVSWLPLYHDMGLIGAWLGSLYYGFAFVVMPPPSFLTRPSRWLSAIGNFRGTISAAPNFGYELCLAKLTDADLEGVDLSSWRLAFNGAEPVSPHTVERFAERFERFGLRREAIAPVYGLAEACVGLAFPPPGRGPVIDRLDRDRFVRSGRAVAAGDDDTNPLRVVACGRALPGHAMRVVDAAGNELGDRQEGRIEFRGPSATSGYFRNPDATARLLDGEWLDTGDLGYLADGDVYVTGRVKDLVIRAGRNLHPDELEAALNALPGVRKGRVAVFAASDPSSGTERLVVLAETRETDDARRSRLRDAILGVTVDILGTPPDEIVLARPGIVLKTSSGKVRRAACRELYEHGRVDAVPRAPWWQLTRVAASTALPRFRRGRRALCGIGFALYAWLCVLVLVPVGAFLVTVLPGRRTRWAVTRALTRALLRTTGTPFTVLGLDSLPRGEPCVVVANHASWLDAAVLGAALPGRPCFVAASELARRRWMRLLLSRLGTEFVQRAARGQSVADTHRLLERSRAGETLVVFPEGRLAQAPGVRPFHLGAFVVAAAARRPVVPVAIRGTRSVLHPGRRLPRRGAITVEVCDALRARDTGWRGAIELRSDAHAAIVAHSDERDVAGPSRLTS